MSEREIGQLLGYLASVRNRAVGLADELEETMKHISELFPAQDEQPKEPQGCQHRNARQLGFGSSQYQCQEPGCGEVFTKEEEANGALHA